MDSRPDLSSLAPAGRWPVLPRHLALIMDGNGRWAAQRGLPRSAGHRAGAEAVRGLLEESRRLEIPYVTVYAFSRENWQRPQTEIKYLFELFNEFVTKNIDLMRREGISMGMIGERSDLPFSLRQLLDWAIARTASGNKMRFTLALSYSGQEEILQAVRKALRDGLPPEKLDDASLRANFYDPQLPDPDLLIRSSGEMRLSNFLLYQCAYTEFYFCDEHWPDFKPESLHLALDSFAARRRRFGRTEEQDKAEACDLTLQVNSPDQPD